MKTPLVSVVIPTYNREKYLAEAIDSILAQTFSDFELIVVDDGSEDSSPEIIQAYESKDPRVRSVTLEGNAGMGTALNRGFDVARGEYIAYMDSDDVSLPTRLEKQLRFLQENPEIGTVGTWLNGVSEDLSTYLNPRTPSPQHAVIVFGIITGYLHNPASATMMMRREALCAVGGWNEGVIHNPQEDFYSRLLFQTSVRFANLTEILYIQRAHPPYNISSHPKAIAERLRMDLTRRDLGMLWGGVCDDTLRRFRALRWKEKLNWADRRAAKKDLMRVIESLVDRQLVRPDERSLLISDMNRRLEEASPRRWQQFCHWRRKWMGGLCLINLLS